MVCIGNGDQRSAKAWRAGEYLPNLGSCTLHRGQDKMLSAQPEEVVMLNDDDLVMIALVMVDVS